MKENMEAIEDHQSQSETMISAEVEPPFCLQCTVRVGKCGNFFLGKLRSKKF